MVCRIAIISQQGALLDGVLTEIAEGALQDAEVSLINASVDYKTSSVLHKGRPLGFSFIDDFAFDDEHLVIILETEIMVSAYKDKLEPVHCPIVGFYKDIKALNPSLYRAGMAPEGQVVGVAEPMVTALGLMLESANVEALDVKALFSAELLGQAGITELAAQTAKLLNTQPLENSVFGKQLPFNFFPLVESQMGKSLESSFTDQLKVAFNIDDVHVFGVQMPVFHGQTLIVSAIFSDAVDLQKMQSSWRSSKRITIIKDPSKVAHLDIANVSKDVMVGCYTRSETDEHRMDFWVTIDENPFAIRESLMPLSELLIKNSL